MTLLLRHKPEVGGIGLSSEGWASVDSVVAAVRRRCGSFTREDLRELVRGNDKQRFQLSPNGRRVRAVQGHSLPVELGLEASEPPQTLYHGTKAALVPVLLQEGLRRMGRQYVHLSATTAAAVQVARRRKGAGVVLRVSTELAGTPWRQAHNGVWLADGVAPGALQVERWLEAPDGP